MQSLQQLAGRQAGVVTRRQALASGLTADAIRGRLARRSWRRLLPGTLYIWPTEATAETRAWAGVLYAGANAVLTGAEAAARYGVRYLPRGATIHVLVPAGATARSRDWLRVTETRRPTLPRLSRGLPVAASERAVTDTARSMTDLAAVRAMVADSVQRGICRIDELRVELEDGPRRGSRLLRLVLDEVSRGARSAPEAALLTALLATGLPEPLCNVPIRDPRGAVVAIPDFQFADVRLAVEVDSREWHLSPAAWEHTMRRHNSLTALGWTVLHFPPSRIRDDLPGVLAEIAATYHRLVRPSA